MRVRILVILSVLLVLVVAAPGGEIALDLSAGGYTIEGTTDTQTRVECDTDNLPFVHSEVKVAGTDAHVTLEGPENNFRARIYVPQHANLRVTQTIGQLRIVNVDGDKDVGLDIGDIHIQVPDATAVKRVEAAADIGSVRADNWHSVLGGFFRTFRATGQGTSSIHAHVNIGDIQLSQSI